MMSGRKVGLLAKASNELQDDAAAVPQLLQDGLSTAVGYTVDHYCIWGDGAGQPLGIFNAPSKIRVTKQTGQAAVTEPAEEREFYEFPGPLYAARISPASAILAVGSDRSFRCVARDKQRRAVEEGLREAVVLGQLTLQWQPKVDIASWRVVRVISRSPSLASSALMRRDTVAFGSPQRSDAREKLPASATRANRARSSASRFMARPDCSKYG